MQYTKKISLKMKLLTLFFLFLINPDHLIDRLHADEIKNLEHPEASVQLSSAENESLREDLIEQNRNRIAELEQEKEELLQIIKGKLPSSLRELVDSTSPSVVTIAIKGTRKVQQNPFFDDPFFERFFGQPQPPRER